MRDFFAPIFAFFVQMAVLAVLWTVLILVKSWLWDVSPLIDMFCFVVLGLISLHVGLSAWGEMFAAVFGCLFE